MTGAAAWSVRDRPRGGPLPRPARAVHPRAPVGPGRDARAATGGGRAACAAGTGGGDRAAAPARRRSRRGRGRWTAFAPTVRRAPATRIHWATVARTGTLVERLVHEQSQGLPLIVFDARWPASAEALDMAVRAAASLCVGLAQLGGCSLLLPGSRSPQPVRRGTWPPGPRCTGRSRCSSPAARRPGGAPRPQRSCCGSARGAPNRRPRAGGCSAPFHRSRSIGGRCCSPSRAARCSSRRAGEDWWRARHEHIRRDRAGARSGARRRPGRAGVAARGGVRRVSPPSPRCTTRPSCSIRRTVGSSPRSRSRSWPERGWR